VFFNFSVAQLKAYNVGAAATNAVNKFKYQLGSIKGEGNNFRDLRGFPFFSIPTWFG